MCLKFHWLVSPASSEVVTSIMWSGHWNTSSQCPQLIWCDILVVIEVRTLWPDCLISNHVALVATSINVMMCLQCPSTFCTQNPLTYFNQSVSMVDNMFQMQSVLHLITFSSIDIHNSIWEYFDWVKKKRIACSLQMCGIIVLCNGLLDEILL